MKRPRVMLAGIQSGCGKTTVTCALMKALTDMGMDVGPFKCGPDYIDPMFHRAVTGNPSVNLDGVFTDEAMMTWLLASHGRDRSVSVIEGVMGYYDGQADTAVGSAWDVAVKTGTPVILIVRPAGAALSVAAMIKGYMAFRQPSMIAGLILNGIREGIYGFYKAMLERELGLPVLGFLPEDAQTVFAGRHLGLVTAGELEDLEEKIGRLGQTALKTLKIDSILDIARKAPDLPEKMPEPLLQALKRNEGKKTVRLAVAMDKAFSFYYTDNLRLLSRMGARILPFSPLSDGSLPEDIHGLYIGGGYPELYARSLAENASMRRAIRRAVTEEGLPVVAECGGYMYLAEYVKDKEGVRWPMCGAVPGECEMTGRLGPFGYVEVECGTDTVLGPAGTRFMAHEFHYSKMTGADGDFSMKKANGSGWRGGCGRKNLYAAYPHLYFPAALDAAVSFMDSMRDWRDRKERGKR